MCGVQRVWRRLNLYWRRQRVVKLRKVQKVFQVVNIRTNQLLEEFKFWRHLLRYLVRTSRIRIILRILQQIYQRNDLNLKTQRRSRWNWWLRVFSVRLRSKRLRLLRNKFMEILQSLLSFQQRQWHQREWICWMMKKIMKYLNIQFRDQMYRCLRLSILLLNNMRTIGKN